MLNDKLNHRLAIASKLDKIPVRIANINGHHRPLGPNSLHRPHFDSHTLFCKVLNDAFDATFAYEAYVTRPRSRNISVRHVLIPEGVQIDLLVAEMKGVELAGEDDMLHFQDSLIELDRPGHVPDGEDQVVNADNFQG